MNAPRRLCKRLACLLLAVAPAGCGFHLAGDRPMPPALGSIYVEVIDSYRVGTPPLEAALQSRIAARGGVVKLDSAQAQTVLRLSDLSETREAVALGPDGTAIEYRLVTRVTFELHDKQGHELVAPSAQGISRDYSFSVSEVLAKEAEEERLRSFMQTDLADLILLRIDAELSRLTAAAH
jgi:LPS-assembly lipoprotein